MNKFPTPPPDRRTQKGLFPPQDENRKYTNQTNIPQISMKKQIGSYLNNHGPHYSYYSNYTSSDFCDNEDLHNNNLNILKLKHIEDMRNNILTYKILNDKKMFLTSNSSPNINKCNIILFGPSGSGKSSFIKTLYRAVYGTPFLPPEAVSKLIIKDTDQNEGTLCFTRLHLKEESNQTSGVILCDTRGHIWMNEEEKEQFRVIINGKVKDDIEITQVKARSPFLLWEFWKKDAELFPKEIFNAKESGLDSIPHNIVFVFDGSIDEIIDINDKNFYLDLVNISNKKGYGSVHIILTRIDIFEKQILEKYKNLPMNERNSILNNLKDKKIETIIDILGVTRSQVHFIENYHSDIEENFIEIDYHALKTLMELLNLCEQFIITNLNKNATCFAKCF